MCLFCEGKFRMTDLLLRAFVVYTISNTGIFTDAQLPFRQQHMRGDIGLANPQHGATRPPAVMTVPGHILHTAPHHWQQAVQPREVHTDLARSIQPYPATQTHGSINSHVDEVHVDLPGQHGNDRPHPVIHRPLPVHADDHSHTGSVHVDLPGQHGNNRPHPVIHRAGHGRHQTNTPHSTVHPGYGAVHVDLPGQHGNNRSHAVVHRTTHDHHPAQALPKSREFHVDGHVDRLGNRGHMSTMPEAHGIMPDFSLLGVQPRQQQVASPQRQFTGVGAQAGFPGINGLGTGTLPSYPHVLDFGGQMFPLTTMPSPVGMGTGRQFPTPLMRRMFLGGSGIMPQFEMTPLGNGMPLNPFMRRRMRRRFRVIRRIRRLENTNDTLRNVIAALLRRRT